MNSPSQPQPSLSIVFPGLSPRVPDSSKDSDTRRRLAAENRRGLLAQLRWTDETVWKTFRFLDPNDLPTQEIAQQWCRAQEEEFRQAKARNGLTYDMVVRLVEDPDGA